MRGGVAGVVVFFVVEMIILNRFITSHGCIVFLAVTGLTTLLYYIHRYIALKAPAYWC
ncbi:hypothetical protein F4860DRAFT_266717 [Xylaria cubensis]|nr:hypothetical protein F4860DRAFT_266717 [Xylaria cubensis]